MKAVAAVKWPTKQNLQNWKTLSILVIPEVRSLSWQTDSTSPKAWKAISGQKPRSLGNLATGLRR
jgi:hypothetical protein